MPPLAWLAISLLAGAIAFAVAWPAWHSYRSRDARDLNTERYLAWRGRSSGTPNAREGMTGEERRRMYAGAALGVVAVVGLLAFFATP